MNCSYRSISKTPGGKRASGDVRHERGVEAVILGSLEEGARPIESLQKKNKPGT